MDFRDSQTLAAKIQSIFADGPVVLFAGAGVSARAELPVWGQYLRGLAEEARRYENLTADLMIKRTEAGEFLSAASLFKTCIEIPAGERQRMLAAPFETQRYDFRRILPLISLPFRAITTTNYDRALHDAYSSRYGVAPQCVELHDPTLRMAPFWKAHYIARIHGRVEVPSSIILDYEDYKSLYGNAEYEDFLKALLTQNRCLFVGFSFVDPAIDRLLNFIKEKGSFPTLHFAVVPDNAKALQTRLAEFNIECISYSNSASNHDLLWEAFEKAPALGLGKRPLGTKTSSTMEIAKRLLAICYSRVHMGTAGDSLREIIVEGIVLSELSKGVSAISDLKRALRQYMALNDQEANSMVEGAVARLSAKAACMSDEGADVVVLVEQIEPPQSPVKLLADGVLARLVLRERFITRERYEKGLCGAIEEVIVVRGFDLGAEFAGADVKAEVDVLGTMNRALDKHLPHLRSEEKQLVAEVFRELLLYPDDREEAVLGDLGRVSFGIELVLQAGRTTMYSLSLPDTVYLDASVLMPAIVPGHPSQAVYQNAIVKLQEAAKLAGGGASIHIADVFLDEIVNHRAKAIEDVANGNLEDIETLRRRIVFHGADKLNVYVGAYAGWISSKRPDNGFSKFLEEVAPYDSVSKLTTFLRAKGFIVTRTRDEDVRVQARQRDAVEKLDAAYRTVRKGAEKPTILIRHEAMQLDLLRANLSSSKRQLFVSADMQLRRVVLDSEFCNLADQILSPRNLVQLVDLLIGMDIPANNLTRLLWSVQAADTKSEIKDYLLKRALIGYNSALLMKLNEMMDGFVQRYEYQAKLEHVDVTATDLDGRMKASRFMDRVEAEVFTELAKEVEGLREKLRKIE